MKKLKDIKIIYVAVLLAALFVTGIVTVMKGRGIEAKNLSFAGKAITLRNEIRYKIFGTSGDSQVTAGKDGWLFYTESLDEYSGKTALSEGEIEEISETLSEINEYFTGKGVKFYFFCAPNKCTVYEDMLPPSYRNLENPSYDSERLYAALVKKGVPTLNARAMLSDASKAETVYHRTDSHWNGYGAWLVTKQILLDTGYFTFDFESEGSYKKDDFDGDLYAMICPEGKYRDTQVYYNFTVETEGLETIRSLMDQTIETTCSQAEGTLFMVRDSFGNAMIPILSAEFGKCTFTRVISSDLFEKVDTDGTDVVIFEIVERNLRNVLKYRSVKE